jgi:hypothetical protein
MFQVHHASTAPGGTHHALEDGFRKGSNMSVRIRPPLANVGMLCTCALSRSFARQSDFVSVGDPGISTVAFGINPEDDIVGLYYDTQAAAPPFCKEVFSVPEEAFYIDHNPGHVARLGALPSPQRSTTTVALAVTPDPSMFGQPVILKAMVGPATATGLVTY